MDNYSLVLDLYCNILALLIDGYDLEMGDLENEVVLPLFDITAL